jgi:UPF0755 protein
VRKLLSLAIAGLLAALIAVGMLWWSAGPKAGPHTLVVEEGSSVAKVASRLESLGAIPGSATTFRAFARLIGSGDPVQAGEFEIPAGTSAAGILDLLQHGRPVQRLVTIPEGMPSILVQEKVAALPFATGMAPIPAEGSVLPDSYTRWTSSSRRSGASARGIARWRHRRRQ